VPAVRTHSGRKLTTPQTTIECSRRTPSFMCSRQEHPSSDVTPAPYRCYFSRRAPPRKLDTVPDSQLVIDDSKTVLDDGPRGSNFLSDVAVIVPRAGCVHGTTGRCAA